MNERIQELAEQAGMVYHCEHQYDAFDEQKFAELLIRECLFIIDDERKPDTVNRTELWKQIKQHFGVSE